MYEQKLNTGKADPAKASDRSADTPESRILAVIRQIPPGCVASYGQIAKAAGLPRRARWVGQVLRRASSTANLPWYRVITAQGRIAFPEGGAAYRRQYRCLRAEGVRFRAGRVDMTRFRWRRDDPSPLLD